MNFNLPLASRGRMTVYLLAIMMLVTCGVGHSQTSLLISVTFKTNNPFGNSPLISGPDPAATLANYRAASFASSLTGES